MANFFASKESRLARSRNDLAAGYKNSFARIRALSEHACAFISPYACVEREISSNRRVRLKSDDNENSHFRRTYTAHTLSLSPIDKIYYIPKCFSFCDSISCKIPAVSKILSH